MFKTFTKLLLLVLAFSAWEGASAQVFFLNENFNGTTGSTPPTGWSNTTLVGGTFDTWRFNNPGGRTIGTPMSSPAAIFDSDDYSGGGGAEDVVLESPAFNTTGYAAVTLKFDHQFESGFGGRATVEVWDGASWVQVYNTTAQVGTSTQTINITSLAANKTGVQVRFRWRGDFSWWWIVDNVQVFYIVDVQTLSVDAPANPCGSATDSVKVTVRNNSAFTVKNIPVSVDLSGGLLSGTQSTTIDSITAGNTRQVTFPGGNTTAGGTLNVKAYTALAGDNTKTNDTTNFSLQVIGTPGPPTVTAGSRCGAGEVDLKATTPLSTDSVLWFDDPNSSSFVAVGSDFKTPVLTGTTNFYAASGRGDFSNQTFTTTLTGTNGSNGSMFNLTPSTSIVIDSLSFLEFNSQSGTYDMRVYYKEGTYVGFNTNAGAWTDHGTYSVTSVGADVPLTFNIDDLKLDKGKLYGIYIVIINGPQAALHYTTLGANTTYSNADITIEAGIGVPGLFGGQFSPRGWNGTIHYKYVTCNSNLVPVTATINDVASGTTLSAKTGSSGTFNGGTLVAPDVNASPDTIRYNLVTPTGFANSNYGNSGTWVVSSTTVRTTGGYTVPSNMYGFSDPNSSNNGEFRLHTDTTLNDSVICVEMNVRRLDNGCDTTIKRFIYIAPRPIARFVAPAVCEGDVTLFNNSTYLQAGTATWEWDFGVNPKVTSDLANPFFQYSTAGTYTVTLTVTSDKGYVDVATETITVNEVPKANFEIQNACEGTPLAFIDASTKPTGTPTFAWEFGDGNIAAAQNPSHQYTNPGIYPIRFVVTVNGCTDEITKYGTQAPRSVPNFNYSPLQCDNAEVTFTNTTTPPSFGNVAYTWKMGDGTLANRKDLTYTYNSFQSYTVVLVGRTDLGCVDSTFQTITLKEAPVTDFNVVGSTCSGENLTFDNITTTPGGSTPNTYEWEFGDANVSTNVSPVHTYTGPGPKTITLRANNANGCTGMKMKTINIDLKPNADFVSKDVCLGTETVLSNNSSIGDASPLTFAWDIEGVTSTNTDEKTTFSTAGSKNVSLIASSPNGCSDTATKAIEIFPQPMPVINIGSQFSVDGSFSFATNTTASSYKWIFGDGGTATTQNTTYQYPVDGRYIVRLVVISDKGCEGRAVDTLNVFRLGIEEAIANGQVKLYPNPGSGNFDVEFDGINTSEIKSVTVFNNLGQKVATVDLATINGNKVAINIEDQAAGVYFIQVETANGKAAFKYNLVK